MQWRLYHDAADGRIPDGEHIDKEIAHIGEFVEFARKQTKRFGLDEVYVDSERYYNESVMGTLAEKYFGRENYPKDKKFPSKQYRAWYNRWNDWQKNLDDDEWEIEEKIMKKEMDKLYKEREQSSKTYEPSVEEILDRVSE